HATRRELPEFLRRGDLVVANVAATLPASLHGVHGRTGAAIEVRLAGRRTLAATDLTQCTALVFGAGDFHTRTEDRAPPPALTARAIRRTRDRGGRVIAVGTTVDRALEHAAALRGAVCAGASFADQRIGAGTRLNVVDALLSGTHEPGTSHYELLRAFMDDSSLREAGAALDAHGYRTHEFGDSLLVERGKARGAAANARLARQREHQSSRTIRSPAPCR